MEQQQTIPQQQTPPVRSMRLKPGRRKMNPIERMHYRNVIHTLVLGLYLAVMRRGGQVNDVISIYKDIMQYDGMQEFDDGHIKKMIYYSLRDFRGILKSYITESEAYKELEAEFGRSCCGNCGNCKK